MMGPRGLKGGWTVIDAQKKCKELGGKEYLGVCLKSQRLDSNADTVPFKCNAFQVLPGSFVHSWLLCLFSSVLRAFICATSPVTLLQTAPPCKGRSAHSSHKCCQLLAETLTACVVVVDSRN